MVIRQIELPKIKKPSVAMVKHAQKMAMAKKEQSEAQALGHGHILAVEAEAQMYKHAMNLSEEMWKHYNAVIAKSKKPSQKLLNAREKMEMDFINYSTRYDSARKYVLKRMTPKKNDFYD